jgi:hypothetical protein
MSKKTYELAISSNYVHTWTVEDAIREIMQNAIDSATDGFKLEVSYSNGTLTITNIGACLSVTDLVLGNSGKDDLTKYIGTYGEGFKLALIVLLRNDIGVTITTNGQRWTPEFRKSMKFKINTLHIDVEKLPVTEVEVSFSLTGIDMDTFKDIRANSLAMSKAMGYGIGQTLPTDYGDILLEPNYKGKMFVNGLYVQTDMSFQYGYDFKPEFVHLDRDRKAINIYKLRELTAKALTSQKDVKLVSTAISKRYEDVKEITSNLNSISHEFKVNFANDFIKSHNLDEETFVGLDKEIRVANKPKVFKTDSRAIAELVNSGLNKEDEYYDIKQKAISLSDLDTARSYYETSDFKTLVDFMYNNRLKIDINVDEVVSMLSNLADCHPSYFRRIKDEVFAKFYQNLTNEGDEDHEE